MFSNSNVEMCASAGQLRCRACGKALPDHGVLAQHLKDAHGGRNSPGAVLPPAAAPAAAGGDGSLQQPPGARAPKRAGGLSLADLLEAALQKRKAGGEAAEIQQQRRERPPAPSVAKPMKGIQGTIRVRSIHAAHVDQQCVYERFCNAV